jgi:hypothetical protein
MILEDGSEAFNYAVLDENGVKLNGVLIDSPYPTGSYPGYGSYLTYEGDDPAPPVPEDQQVAPKLYYLAVRPSQWMNIGDTMDIHTGQVTPAPQPEPEPEPLAEE